MSQPEVTKAVDSDVTLDLALTNPGSSSQSPTLPSPRTIPHLTGLALGRYRVGKLLGAGGMGQVYEAEDTVLFRRVALKLLREVSLELKERFLHEARLQAGLDHPGICQVHDAGDIDGMAYIAMQLVHGVTLTRAATGMRLEEKVALIRDVADAVHAAHRHGLIHRDLKPDNILVEKRDGERLRSFVTDFGLAREMEGSGFTRTGLVAGTPSYMAPEQVRGENALLDRRTDVFALGVTLYEVLVGKRPFGGETALDTMIRILESDPVPPRAIDPSVPEDLETIVMTCLERERHDRYDSARALAEDLSRFLDGEPIVAKPIGLLARLARRARKQKALVAVTLGSFLLVGTLAGFLLNERLGASRRAALAQELGGELTSMGYQLRLALALPPHDIRRDRAAARRRVVALEQRLPGLARPSQATAHAALGRGLLLLKDLEGARQELQKAWDQGLRDPDVALALAESLIGLYVSSAEAAERVPSKALQKEQLKRVESRYRAPALEYLRLAGDLGDGSHRELLLARRHFAEGSLDQALEKSRHAFALDPGLAEASVLAATVLMTQARILRYADRQDEAARTLEEAGVAIAAARDVLRSDPAIYELDCTRRRQLVSIARERRQPLEATLAAAQAACEAVLAIDPDSSHAHQEMVWIAYRAGENVVDSGGDWRTPIDRAIAAGERAVALEPSNASALAMLGFAYDGKAEFQLRSRESPEPAVTKAIDVLERALVLDPTSFVALSELGNALSAKAQHVGLSGGDPVPLMNRALDAYGKVLAVQPDLPATLNNMGATHLALALAQIESGQDVRPACEKGQALYDRLLAKNPSLIEAWTNMGTLQETRAEYELRQGLSPQAAIAAGRRAARSALALDPEDAISWGLLAQMESLDARSRLAEGQDPSPAVAATAEASRRALSLNVSLVGPRSARAAAQIALARFQQAHGGDATSAIAAARSAFDGLPSDRWDDGEAATSLARVELEAARWATSRGRDPRASLDRAAELLARARKSSEQNVDGRLLLARHALLLTQVPGQPSGPTDATREGLRVAKELVAKSGPWPEAQEIATALERSLRGLPQ